MRHYRAIHPWTACSRRDAPSPRSRLASRPAPPARRLLRNPLPTTRSIHDPCAFTPCWLFFRTERKIKRCAAPNAPLGPQAPSVPLHDPRYGCQTDAVSRILGGRMQALKSLKQPLTAGHVEPHAIVAHEIYRRSILFDCTELNPRRQTLAGELPGVLQKIEQRG